MELNDRLGAERESGRTRSRGVSSHGGAWKSEEGVDAVDGVRITQARIYIGCRSRTRRPRASVQLALPAPRVQFTHRVGRSPDGKKRGREAGNRELHSVEVAGGCLVG